MNCIFCGEKDSVHATAHRHITRCPHTRGGEPPADGAVGAHFQAVQSVAEDFRTLAHHIAEHTGISL